MKLWKLAAVAGLGIVTAVSASAAPMTGVADLDTPTSIEEAKAKGKSKRVRARPGKCGTYMYYNRKTRACADKRG